MCFFLRSCCLNSSIQSRLHFQKGAENFFWSSGRLFFLFSKRWKTVLNWLIAKPDLLLNLKLKKKIHNWVCYSKSVSLDGVKSVLVNNISVLRELPLTIYEASTPRDSFSIPLKGALLKREGEPHLLPPPPPTPTSLPFRADVQFSYDTIRSVNHQVTN